ncbi:MAG: hypothetical protein KA118_19910 [Verrucomicrobia bacterium]|nr:hypothetical protein [Verrucomicrobiota bacterium]
MALYDQPDQPDEVLSRQATLTNRWSTNHEGTCQNGSPTTNPSGKNIPKAGNNPMSGQNPDGFYELRATDNCNFEPGIFVGDTASDFMAWPFGSGQRNQRGRI